VVDTYVHSQAVAEEIVQDLFFVLWMKRESLHVRDSLRGYLFSAARNRALHHVRHQSIVRRLALLVRSADDAATIGLGRPPATPVESLEMRESRRTLRQAIDGLPPRSRCALVLRLDHEMSHKEIALAMGISIKGVEKLIAVAMRGLRARLDQGELDRVRASRSVR
jgi:RNA polymerase sigma-19 factor, ECF subfamily